MEGERGENMQNQPDKEPTPNPKAPSGAEESIRARFERGISGGTQQLGETPPPADAGGAGGVEGGPPAPPVEPPAPGEPPQEEPSDQGGGITKEGINNPLILSEIDVANELVSAGKSPNDILGKALENIVRLRDVNEAEKRLAIDRIKAAIRQYEQISRVSTAEERRNRLRKIDDEAIGDMSLKPFVSQINSFIDIVKAGKLDRNEQLRLINDINGRRPPDNYTNDQVAIFERDRELLKREIGGAAGTILNEGDQEKAQRLTEQLIRVIDEDQDNRYEEIEDIIRSIKIDSGVYAAVIGNVVEAVTGKDDMLEFLLEYGVERILGTPDEKPKEQYPQFNLYELQNLDSVIQAARRYGEDRGNKKMFGYLLDLKTKRHAMHELFRGMKDRKTYVDLVTQLLRKEGFAFVEKEIVGVSDIQIIYEEVLGSDLSLKEGWLTSQDFEVADEEARRSLQYSLEVTPGMLQKEFIRNGISDSRPLREWEMNRAWLMGRSLGAASQRRLTYGVMGDAPFEDVDTLLKSVESEFLARILAPLKLIPERFFFQRVAQRYIRKWLDNIKKDSKNGDKETRYGYIDEKDKKAKGLYGKSQDALAILDTGVADPKSRSWLARNILLKQARYKREQIGEDRLSIGEYLNEQKALIKKQVEDDLKAANPRMRKNRLEILVEKQLDKSFNDAVEVKEAIGRQRLFLGALMLISYPSLNPENKKTIWENVAKLIPSRMAAFFPEETLESVKNQYNIHSGNPEADRKEAMSKWKEIRIKLFNIERARVKNDAVALKTNGDGITRNLEFFFDRQTDSKGRVISEGLDNNEQQLIRAIQSFGKAHAKDLSTIKFPFTAFLDDAPETDWDEASDGDLERVLISDHSAFEEGYGGIINVINNPGATPGDVLKAFLLMFEKVQNPIGIQDTQGYLEPHVTTYLSMARLNPIAKWLGSAMKIGRVPRSELEQDNLQSNIAQDAVDQSDFLTALAQKKGISDNPDEIDEKGRTQLMRMKEENDADAKAKLAVYVRLIILLLGPIAGMELIKLILPQETAKSLGL